MKVLWSPVAIADLASIRDYIANDSDAIASALIARLIAAANSLEAFPPRGRLGRAPSTLELVIAGTPYIIVYASEDGAVHIASVDHAARRA